MRCCRAVTEVITSRLFGGAPSTRCSAISVSSRSLMMSAWGNRESWGNVSQAGKNCGRSPSSHVAASACKSSWVFSVSVMATTWRSG